MFKKYANIPIEHLVSADYDTVTKRLAFRKNASQKFASHYVANSDRVSVQDILNLVSDEYNISSNPSDFIYEAVRAVTAEVPNDNGDAFPRAELLRFDHKLGKAVYQTFIGKPHHVNHRADNPKTARGVVIDAYYNDSADPDDSCKSCGLKTASLDNRDVSGIHCKKCGSVVKDEFVELLLAIDTTKDKTFAEGVRTGALSGLSMGCEAGHTDCSICGNRARTVQQFCQHIRSGNKKKMFKTASGDRMSFEKCGEVRFTEISRVDQPADGTARQREVFSISPEAMMSQETESLVMATRLANLENKVASEDEHVGPSTPFKTIAESIRWAETSIAKLEGENKRLASEKESRYHEASSVGKPFYAWEKSAIDQQIKANNNYISRLGSYVLRANELQASGEPWMKPLSTSMSRFFASKNAQTQPSLDALGDAIKNIVDDQGLQSAHPEIVQKFTEVQNMMPQQPGGPQTPGVMGPNGQQPGQEQQSFEQYSEEKQNSQFDNQITPSELGIVPDDQQVGRGLPGATASVIIDREILADIDAMNDLSEENTVSTTVVNKWARAYDSVEASVSKNGNVKIEIPGQGTLFVVRPDEKPATKEAAIKLGEEVLSSIANEGIVGTVLKYNSVVGTKMAQVLQHSIVDFAGGRKDGDSGPITDDAQFDMANREKPEKSMVTPEETDRKDMVRQKKTMGDSVLKEVLRDHIKPESPAKHITENDMNDMSDSRQSPPKTMIDDIQLDIKDKKASKKEANVVMLLNLDSIDNMDELASQLEQLKGDDMGMGMPGDDLGLPAADDMGLDGLEADPMDGPPDMGGDESMDKDSMEYCAEDCAEEHEHKREKKAQDVPPAAPASAAPAPAPMPMAAGLSKEAAAQYTSRLERLYKNRISKVKEDALKKISEAEEVATKKVASKFLRALKIAAKRQALNLEDSPIKAAMFDTLTSEFDIDVDTYYPGMDNMTAAAVIEKTSANSYDTFVDVLLKRAHDLMAMPEDAVASIEADLSNLKPVPTTIVDNATKVAGKSTMARQAALDGNLPVTPASNTSEGISDVSGRDNIRSALSTTKVARRITNKG
jgi:hypothetical protein